MPTIMKEVKAAILYQLELTPEHYQNYLDDETHGYNYGYMGMAALTKDG